MPAGVRGFVREFASFGALLSFLVMVAMWGEAFGRAARF
jgi:hypothetical protein